MQVAHTPTFILILWVLAFLGGTSAAKIRLELKRRSCFFFGCAVLNVHKLDDRNLRTIKNMTPAHTFYYYFDDTFDRFAMLFYKLRVKMSFHDKELPSQIYRLERVRRGAIDFETIPLGNFCSDIRHLKVEAQGTGWQGPQFILRLRISCHREPSSYARYNTNIGRKFGVESKLKMSNTNLLKSTQFIEQVSPNRQPVDTRPSQIVQVDPSSEPSHKNAFAWIHLAKNLGSVIWHFGKKDKEAKARNSLGVQPREESMPDLANIMAAQDSY